MSYLRRLMGFSSNDQDKFLGEETMMIYNVETKITFKLNVNIRRVGTTVLTKELLLKEILDNYRGSSEKEAFFWLGSLLSYEHWIKKKDSTGYGFIGDFNVKFETDNRSLLNDFDYESVSTYVKNNWIILITANVKTRCSKGGFNPSSKLYNVIRKVDIKTALIDFQPTFLIH
ncbi:matrix [Burg el Arab virus]|nr:matrix [Burg el Arab virus]UAU42898.1 matrix [Burg el Arab virus]